MENVKPVEVEIKLQEIELEKIDFSEYVGKETFIADYKTMKGEIKGKESYFVKILGAPVGTYKNAEGKKTDIIPSKILGIQRDKNGIFGWGKDTKLGEFLKSKRVNSLEELKGKKVIVQMTDKGFLTFI